MEAISVTARLLTLHTFPVRLWGSTFSPALRTATDQGTEGKEAMPMFVMGEKQSYPWDKSRKAYPRSLGEGMRALPRAVTSAKFSSITSWYRHL